MAGMSVRQSKKSQWPAGSKFARPEDSVGFLLWQTLHRWQRYATAGLADLDLTHMQFTVLAAIGWLSREAAPPIQTAVADHCQLDAMTVSQLVRTLEKKGFVARTAADRDARAKAVSLTGAGTAALAAALPRIDEMDRAFFAPADVDALMRELGAVYRGPAAGRSGAADDEAGRSREN